MILMSGWRRLAGGAAIVSLCVPSTALANGASDALRARAAAAIYNLDRDEAIALYRQAIAADPSDAAAYRGLATGLWLSITFRRGNMTIDDYLGGYKRPNEAPPPAPRDVVAAFNGAVDQASNLARKRIDANARDVDAHFQLGAAFGLRASYAATVENSLRASFSAARQAYQEHQRVLDLDPRRKDAGLIVGTYRYVVSVLALPLRVAAYLAGFGGGKEEGVRMVEEAAAYGGDNQEDARFALVLLYNREHRYDDALKQLATLRAKFTRNRLLWVESGATSLRAGRPADADRFITEGLMRFASDTRPRMFGEDAIAYYKRGAARAALGRTADAEQDLRKAIGLEGRNWVHGRAHLELGELALRAGNHAAARKEFGQAATLCDADNDGASADEARMLERGAR